MKTGSGRSARKGTAPRIRRFRHGVSPCAKIEFELESERKHFLDVMDILPVYLVLLTPDHHVAFANRFFRERFGEDRGRRCFEYLFGRTEPCENCITYKVMETNAPLRWEWTGPDGRDYDIFDFPFTDTDGSPLIMEVGIDITERKRAEKALKEANEALERRVAERTAALREIAEELLRAKQDWERTFDSVPDMIAVIDNQRRIVRANRAMAERLGLTPEECVGRFCNRCVHGTDVPPPSCPHVQTMADGRQHAAELHEPRLGGDFMTTTTPLLDEEGIMRGVVHVARDITERKRAEQALLDSRTDLNRAQAVAHVGSWRLDVRNNVLLWSDETHRIFGIPKGTPMTYETFLDAVHQEDRDYVDRKWTAALRGEPYDIEHRIMVGNGVKWVRERAELEFDREGMLLGGFGTTQDITEIKRAEEALRESENRFKSFAENLPSILVRYDKDKRIMYISPGIKDVTGTDAAGYIGKTNLEAGLPQHLVELGDDAIGEVFRSARNRGLEFFFPTPKGVRTFYLILAPEFALDGKVEHVLGIATDITAQKRAQEILERDKEELEELIRDRTRELLAARDEIEKAKRLSDIGTLAATVAHELRNPLAAIRMASYNIRRKTEGHLLDTHLKSIETKVDESAQIINNLLFYSRLKMPHYEPASIFEILSEICAHARGIKGKTNLAEDYDVLRDIKIEADPLQMRELFNNVINNACDAVAGIPRGRVSIRAELSDQDSAVTVRVNDNGKGIAKEYLDKVFDPFFSTKAKGTGLGLTVAHHIVGLHGGKISIESPPGSGTTVIISLPIKRMGQEA